MEESIKNESVEVENLLNSVSDEYLAKRKKTRIISYSIILTIVLALAVTIITLSCIKVDLKPSFITDASSYRVTISNTEVMTIDESNDEFKEFNNIYLNSFNSHYLTALFTGRLGGYKIEETYDYFYSDTANSTGMSTALKNALGSDYVRAIFDESKQILNSDGSVYYSKVNTDTTLSFNEMYFSLSDSKSEHDLVFYFGVTGYYSRARILKITVRANTYDLYKFVTE